MNPLTRTRTIGRSAVAAVAIGAALALPASALATDLLQDPPISWNSTAFPGEDCGDLDLDPGQVAWHFVLTQPEADAGHLKASFDIAGDITVQNADSPAAVLHFYVFTGQDTLLGAETTDVDGNNLVLSHICVGPEEEETPPSEEETPPSEEETPPSEEGSPSTEVLGETGRPRVTPPATDTIVSSGGRSGDPMPLFVVLASVATVAALGADRARSRARR